MTPCQKRIDIGDRALTLNFNFTTMRVAEKELGAPIHTIFNSEAGAVGFEAMSVIWWAALNRKHKMTREATDQLVDEAGLEQVTTWIVEGLSEYSGTGDASADDAPATATATATATAGSAEGKGKGKGQKAA